MRHYYRLIILSSLLLSGSANAWQLFVDALDWRATETNDWAYVNSEQLPSQTVDYKTIDFKYTPGFRVGARYTSITTWDALFSYTRFYTTTNDSTVGNIQPSFLGSVTAKPSHHYLYSAGQVKQTIDYNIFDVDFGREFHPAAALMIHPIAGVMGGWINQTITAKYQGTINSSNEQVTNNFSGVGPKAGVDTDIILFNHSDYQSSLIAAFSASYLLGYWSVDDNARSQPTGTYYYIKGSSHHMGALTLQGLLGFKLEHNNFALKLAYEIGDWFNQSQFMDNDTGTHNNDLVLQGLTLGLSYSI